MSHPEVRFQVEGFAVLGDGCIPPGLALTGRQNSRQVNMEERIFRLNRQRRAEFLLLLRPSLVVRQLGGLKQMLKDLTLPRDNISVGGARRGT